MLAHFSTRLPQRNRQGLASTPILHALLAATALALLLLLAACGSLPPAPLAAADPADAHAPVPPVAYRSTLGSQPRARPVEAGSWQEQNQRLAPKEQP
jgi:hypothetical protein